MELNQLGLRKCPYYRYLIEKVTSTDVRTTNISQSLPHKMAENSLYEEITSLSPYVFTMHKFVCLLHLHAAFSVIMWVNPLVSVFLHNALITHDEHFRCNEFYL